MATPEPVAPERAAPELVTLHLWGVPRRHVPTAMTRMALDRRAVRALPGVRFAKLLGTGDGRTFTLRDADLRHWGLLVSWARRPDAHGFARSATATAWGRLAEESLRVDLRPLSSKGTWAGRLPFGEPVPGRRWTGPAAALTRARLAPARTRRFWAAVPPVSADLRGADGLRLAVGVGEAPVGLQGTFSLWDSLSSLTAFARSPEHAEVARRTPEERWYAEELFARFAVLDVTGTYRGRTPAGTDAPPTAA